MKTFKTTVPDLSAHEAPKLRYFAMWKKGIRILFFGILTFLVSVGPIWILGTIFSGWKLGSNEEAFGIALDICCIIYLLLGMPVVAFKAFHWMGFKLKEENKN